MESLENTLSEHVLQESSDKGEAIFHRGISHNDKASLAIVTSPLWDPTKARTKWKLSFHGDQNGEKGFLGIKTRVTQAPVMVSCKLRAERSSFGGEVRKCSAEM